MHYGVAGFLHACDRCGRKAFVEQFPKGDEHGKNPQDLPDGWEWCRAPGVYAKLCRRCGTELGEIIREFMEAGHGDE